jgi:hypothetical protein
MADKHQLQIDRCCGTSAELHLFRSQLSLLKTDVQLEDRCLPFLVVQVNSAECTRLGENAPCADARRFSGPCSMQKLALRNVDMMLREQQRVEANLLLWATGAVFILHIARAKQGRRRMLRGEQRCGNEQRKTSLHSRFIKWLVTRTGEWKFRRGEEGIRHQTPSRDGKARESTRRATLYIAKSYKSRCFCSYWSTVFRGQKLFTSLQFVDRGRKIVRIPVASRARS